LLIAECGLKKETKKSKIRNPQSEIRAGRLEFFMDSLSVL